MSIGFNYLRLVLACWLSSLCVCYPAWAQTESSENGPGESKRVVSKPVAAKLEDELKELGVSRIAATAQERGRSEDGALVFFQSAAACQTCHADRGEDSPLGPSLTDLGGKMSRSHIVESILYPSEHIRDGYQTLQVLMSEGTILRGLQVDRTAKRLLLRTTDKLDTATEIDLGEVEAIRESQVSLMPEGLAGALRSRQQFYDLVEYVYAVARGGKSAADQLRPTAEQLIVTDDTQDLDHRGILESLDESDYEVGKQIYFGHCVNCHGPDGNTPKLATARAFGRDRLKFGADPLSMLGTLTFGKGLMGSMRHLSPKERYQVIHFIREEFMRDENPYFVELSEEYLKSLPQGSGSGEFVVETQRDFGPVLASQLGQQVNSGLTFRLNGEATVNYDLHRMRLGGVWTGGFLDLSETQHFRQRGERMPQPVGQPLPGLGAYAWELNGRFDFEPDMKPPRGSVHSEHAEYFGHYLYGDQAMLSYRIGQRAVLEAITAVPNDISPVIRHTLRIAPGRSELRLRVLEKPDTGEEFLDVSNRLQSATASVMLRRSRAEEEYQRESFENRAWFEERPAKSRELDLGSPGRTILVRFRTREGGTLIASTPRQGRWQPNGKTLFVRGGKLVFDIGWVGAIVGRDNVADGRWHTAAILVGDEQTRLYLDGRLQGKRDGFRRPAADGHVLKIGATATNFGGDFTGDIAWVSILDGLRSPEISQAESLPEERLWDWTEDQLETDASSQEPSANDEQKMYAIATLRAEGATPTWEQNDQGDLLLVIPAATQPQTIQLQFTSLSQQRISQHLSWLTEQASQPLPNLQNWTRGGPERWPQRLVTQGTLGQPINGYALDTIEIPFDNPWNAWMRTSALDFFDDGRCVVTTHGGDVYIVSNIDHQLQQVSWKRFAAGLFEPFGVRVVNDQIFVMCRDGIKRLHDFDGDDEADFVEAFWNDDDVSCMFHAYNFDLQTDSLGNFYFAKAGQYTRHHRPGTIMKVPPEGGQAEVVAWGLRTPNGMGKLADDRFTVSDNQGPWMPAGKISLIEPDGFYGNMPINEEQDSWLRQRHGGRLPETFDEPMIWMPQELDNSCGGQLWVDDSRWGPLAGRLIHSSFGKGWLYYLSLQEIEGTTQASIVALDHQWDAGVMRLRVNPADGQVYGTGLSGWQGPAGGADGCLQRLRYTGRPARMVERTRVIPEGLELTFNFALQPNSLGSLATSGKQTPEAGKHQSAAEQQLELPITVQIWDYLWSRRYGSDQFSVLKQDELGRDTLQVQGVQLSEDGRTLRLKLPQLEVCDQALVKLNVRDADGQPFQEDVYFTIHHMPEPETD